MTSISAKHFLRSDCSGLADATGNRAARRAAGVTRTDDAGEDAVQRLEWERTFAEIEALTAKQEQLLRAAGVLPDRTSPGDA